MGVTPPEPGPSDTTVEGELVAELTAEDWAELEDDPLACVFGEEVSRMYLTAATAGAHDVVARLVDGEHRLRLRGMSDLAIFLSADRLYQRGMRDGLSVLIQQFFSGTDDAARTMMRTEALVRHSFSAVARTAVEAILEGGVPHPPSAALMEAARQVPFVRAGARVIAAGAG